MKLLKFMKEKNLTLQEVSDATGISISLLSKINNNLSAISPVIGSKLTNAYGIFFRNDVDQPSYLADKYKKKCETLQIIIESDQEEIFNLTQRINELENIIYHTKRTLNGDYYSIPRKKKD